jgi:autotransporter strand-loop-strand O-heptosyltransferase
VGWFSYAERFALQQRSKTTIAMREKFIPLFAPVYPGLNFARAAEIVPQDYYATYRVMLYFGDAAHDHQPFDYQLIGLHEAAAYLLGVDPSEQRPRLAMPDPDPEGRPIAGPYVCIATQSTGQYKYWNNPDGWREVIAALRGAGYQVVCIDQQRLYGQGIVWNHIPNGVQDETGDRPLMERVRWLRHAEFFIGLSSGLSWLAWAVGIPVVLISGFTHPLTEFHTPYRVINHHVCNSCWNDIRLTVSHNDFLQCPRHKDTPRQFECTKMITAVQVLGAIRRIPAVAARLGRGA